MNINQIKKDFDDGVLLGKETLRQLIAHTLLIETCAAKQVDEWNAVHNGHKVLVRELDVLLNGEASAAKQASLCDIVAQVRDMVKNPAFYVHAMHDEKGEYLDCKTSAVPSPLGCYGRAGVEYDETYKVLTQKLIAVGPAVEA